MDAADLQKAIPLIRENYLNPASLTDTEMQRATLAGVLDRLGRGVMLLPARESAAPSPAPFYREILDGHLGYLRPGELSQAQLEELDATLRGFAGKKISAVILDLRASAETNNFALAANFAGRFVAKGTTLFTLRGPAAQSQQTFVSDQTPLYQGLVVLLADVETAGAAEVLAAVLRTSKRAIVIGQTTAGRAVAYADRPLPSGKILRVAAAEAILPDGRPRFPDGVPPDLPVALPIAAKREIFQESLTKGMASFVFETDRPHLNEAALLAGTNPEIEAVQAAQKNRAQGGGKPALHDAVLQRGVDLVTSIEIYEKQSGHAP
ncbi:MAG: S41 family peptidase [Verrucomicrobiota bacterium]|nr:S41 family peptidase [Verrucomicrobiota bacterium]